MAIPPNIEAIRADSHQYDRLVGNRPVRSGAGDAHAVVYVGGSLLAIVPRVEYRHIQPSIEQARLTEDGATFVADFFGNAGERIAALLTEVDRLRGQIAAALVTAWQGHDYTCMGCNRCDVIKALSPVDTPDLQAEVDDE